MTRETNLEHYKNELKPIFQNFGFVPELMCKHIEQEIDKSISKLKGEYYTDIILDWMSEPYKAPILNDVEKDYLSAVLKPFRTIIKYISIWNDGSKQFLHIELYDDESVNFPNFKANTMYKGMEPKKRYTLDELGL